MRSGQRAAARRQRLLADNRCVNCAEKLTFDDIGHRQECASCRGARAENDERRIDARREDGLCPMCGEETSSDDVREYKCCAACRKSARDRWNARRDPAARPSGPRPGTKWKDLEFAKPCGVCGLRGEHECITAGTYASARRVA